MVLFKDAIELLEAQKPQVMTLKEVVAAKQGTVVWLEDVDKSEVIAGLVDMAFAKAKEISFQLVWRTFLAGFDDYGTRWRCWTARPTEAEREAVPWNG